MTWGDLKDYIKLCEKKNKNFLNSDAKVYDFTTGDEFESSVTELLFGENENEEDDSGWVPYLTINHEEETDDAESEA